MSDLYSDDHLASRLRLLMSDAEITIREAAEAINIPYRTLQNQLAGNNRMPASTFAKLVEMLEVTPQFVATGRLKLNHRSLAEALVETLGELLPVVDQDYVSHPAPSPDSRSAAERLRHAKAIAFILADRYELLHGNLKHKNYEVDQGPQA